MMQKIPFDIANPAHIEAVRVALARMKMSAFVRYTYPGDYKMGWLHEEICRELDGFLEAVLAGQSPRLLITVPPRHGKSELASRRFPAYAFGRDPDLSIISTSYAADLSTRMNRDVQRVMDSDEYRRLFPDARLFEKNIRTFAHGTWQRNSDLFEIVGHRGSYRSAGVGGGITGMGGDILIIDDPIKDRAEADSPTIRDKVWDWFTSTLYTRLEAGGGILLIQTRWHMDDLAGRLLSAGGRRPPHPHNSDQPSGSAGEASADELSAEFGCRAQPCWRVVSFPAIAETDEAHRKAGEALHPERYSLAQLMATRAALGARDWAALYQQRPAPDGGAIFRKDWLRYWLPKDLPRKFDRMLISWDMAFKDRDDSDFVVGQVWGRSGADHYLLDQVRGRLGFTATLQAFTALAGKWPQALEKLIEDKANGPAVIDALKHKVAGLIPIEPDGSKAARAHAVTPLFEAGNVHIPDPQVADWASDYEAELLQFPAGAHDDQVDATTQALRRWMAKPPLSINPAILRPVLSPGPKFGRGARL
jgi:predicted phage terminase large subunit-like protein